MMYKTPEQYFFRLHHIRPRFKVDVENVLVYMAVKLNEIPRMGISDFMELANIAIRHYPGNAIVTEKTINNWRTEISALFGLIEYDSLDGECWPSAMSENLAAKQDLVEFFKYFLYYFQYPGGHIAPEKTLELINTGIKFKPTKYILELLQQIEKKTDKPAWITKPELTHCVFNDLRVTRDQRSPDESAELILENRKKELDYDTSGDVIRYAGDILDYMVIADLLNVYTNKYYLEKSEAATIMAFIKSKVYFHEYDNLYGKQNINIEQVNVLQDDWFHFVNQKLETDIFKTDIYSYLGLDKSKLPKPEVPIKADFPEGGTTVSTKEIGDFGEHLVFGHECQRLKNGGREDLIHLVQHIPTPLGMGFDIKSVELDGSIQRYIEVKSTISNQKIKTDTFFMTPNEWVVAESNGPIYYIFRLMISKYSDPSLFIIQDPVGKYKAGLLKMKPVERADITFTEKSGENAELLKWEA